MEITNINKMKLDENNFIGRSLSALGCIVNCFKANHSKCRVTSTVCLHHLKNQQELSTKYLTFNKPLELDFTDLKSIMAEILKVMNILTLRSIRHLFYTNLCESLNAGILHYVPKITNWGRNFSALCHSTTHSRKLGRGQSTISLAKAVGIKVPNSSQIYVQMKSLDRTSQFHKGPSLNTKKSGIF